MKQNSTNNQNILTSSLFEICSQQGSGTLFIMTHHNSSAQFIIERGTITQFSFDDTNGIDAAEEFKNATYYKSKFIENYQFPLTKTANIACSNCLLNELGYNDYLIDLCLRRSQRSHYKCVTPHYYDSPMLECA